MLLAMLPVLDLDRLLSLAAGGRGRAAPPARSLPRLARLRGRRWAVVPPLSVIGFVFVARAAEHASAQGLTYLALCAVPLLAALALGWLARGARPARALLVVPLFALAWADRGGLAGEGAALVLSALSCVALGVLLAAVTPPALAGRRDRRYGARRHGARGLRPAAAAQQRAQRRAPGGGPAAAAERSLRLGGDGLRRPVHRRRARRRCWRSTLGRRACSCAARS